MWRNLNSSHPVYYLLPCESFAQQCFALYAAVARRCRRVRRFAWSPSLPIQPGGLCARSERAYDLRLMEIMMLQLPCRALLRSAFRVIVAAVATTSLATLYNGCRMIACDHGRDPRAGSTRATRCRECSALSCPRWRCVTELTLGAWWRHRARSDDVGVLCTVVVRDSTVMNVQKPDSIVLLARRKRAPR